MKTRALLFLAFVLGLVLLTSPLSAQGLRITNPFESSDADDEAVEEEERGPDREGRSRGRSWVPRLPKLSMPRFELPTMGRRETDEPEVERRPMPTRSRPSRSRTRTQTQSNQPSAWTRLNNGTKSFFVKTKDVLMPWAKQDPTPPAPPTGARPSRTNSRAGSAAARTASAPRDSGRSFPLFGRNEPRQPDKIDNVQDFLQLPPPTFGSQ